MQLKRGLCQMMYQMSTRKCSGEKRSEPLTAAETGTHVSKCYWITDGVSLWAKKKVGFSATLELPTSGHC